MRLNSWLVALALPAAFAASAAHGADCPNIVGTWNSWASGLFGQGDTQEEREAQKKQQETPTRQRVAETRKPEPPMARGDDAAQSNKFKQRGLDYLIKRDFARAIAEFTEAIRLDPKDAELFYYRGNAQSDPDRAIADYDEAIRLNPKYDLAFSNRASSYVAKGEYDRAIQDYDEALRLDPRNPVKLWKRAAAYQIKGDYDRAIEDWDQVIRLNPGNQDAVENRALAVAKRSQEKALQNVGFYNRFAMYGVPNVDFPSGTAEDSDLVLCSNGGGETGIAACTREIDADRKYGKGATRSLTSALLDRATMYGAQGLYDRAIQDFDAAIQVNQWPAAYNWRGLTYGMKGDYDSAIADFSQAIQLDSDYAVAYYNRGQTYRLEGKYELAIKDFNQAIGLNSDYILAYRMRGSAQAAIGKYDAAIADFSKAIDLSPNYAAAFDGRGMAYLGKRDYKRAMQDFDQAVRISPGYSESRDIAVNAEACTGSRASAEERLRACRSLIGNSSLPADIRADAYVAHAAASVTTASNSAQDANRIIGDLSEAIRLSPQNAGAYRARSAILLQRGEMDRALADVSKVLELESNSLTDLVFRSLLYSRKGDSDRAMADLDRAIRHRASLTFTSCAAMSRASKAITRAR